MKKFVAALLLLGLIFSFASCADTNTESTTTSSSTQEPETPVVTMTSKEALDSLFVPFLTNMAPAFGAETADDIKGYFVGMDVDTITETDPVTGEEFSYPMPKNEPSFISLEDTEVLYSMTYFPTESVSKIKDAAIFYNMMNMNNGTYAAFSFENAADLEAVAATLADTLKNNHWQCGFPDGYAIMRVDNVLLCTFGLNDSLTAFKGAVSSTYVTAETLFEGTI